MDAPSSLRKASKFLLLGLLSSSCAWAETTTDLTGQDFTPDQLVEALAIPVRGIGNDCSAEQEEMNRLTRGISSVPTSAAEVPALKPMKTASVTATFEKGSAQLTPSAKQSLKTVATALKSQKLQNQCFQVAGHTCDLGDNAYNMHLSQERAAEVKSFLVAQGVNPNRLVTTGFGETSPLVPNSTEIDRQKNRRVDLGALPPK